MQENSNRAELINKQAILDKGNQGQFIDWYEEIMEATPVPSIPINELEEMREEILALGNEVKDKCSDNKEEDRQVSLKQVLNIIDKRIRE